MPPSSAPRPKLPSALRLKPSPRYAKAWAWLGRIQYEAGRYAEAAASYEQAVTLDPQDSAAAHFLRQARAQLR